MLFSVSNVEKVVTISKSDRFVFRHVYNEKTQLSCFYVFLKAESSLPRASRGHPLAGSAQGVASAFVLWAGSVPGPGSPGRTFSMASCSSWKTGNK